MTYAESIVKRIERQKSELQRHLEGIDDETANARHGEEWSANEVLLHLIGDTGEDVTAGLRRALTEDNPHVVREQPGGEYLPVAGAAFTNDLWGILVRQLDEIAEAARDLDDDALARPVSLAGEGVKPLPSVPVGLWLRDAVGDHFDAHVKQLAEAIAQATADRR